jgi:hypothetical protein
MRVGVFHDQQSTKCNESTKNSRGSSRVSLRRVPRDRDTSKNGGYSGDYAVSWWTGKVAGILIGTAIAIALFRSAARKPK